MVWLETYSRDRKQLLPHDEGGVGKGIMNWMLSNWVERRASKEQHLRSAAGVWRNAMAAILQATGSLRRHYSDVATVEITEHNRDHVIIEITPRSCRGITRRDRGGAVTIDLQFLPEAPQIIVGFDRGRIQRFVIEADCDHAYVAFQGKELLLDEFSRLVLEETFFNLAAPESISVVRQSPEAALQYVNELVRRLEEQRGESKCSDATSK